VKQKSSTLGLEQPGDAAAGPAPEREPDAAALMMTVAITARVDPPAPPMEPPAPDATKVEEDVVGAG
jgi:hypothetical protein